MCTQSNFNLVGLQVLLEVDFALTHDSVEKNGKLFGATVNNTGL